MLGVFLVKELWSLFKNSYKENTKALQETTLAITELKVELKHINEKLADMPKMKRDIDVAHELIRQLRGSPPRGAQ